MRNFQSIPKLTSQLEGWLRRHMEPCEILLPASVRNREGFAIIDLEVSLYHATLEDGLARFRKAYADALRIKDYVEVRGHFATLFFWKNSLGASYEFRTIGMATDKGIYFKSTCRNLCTWHFKPKDLAVRSI